MNIFNLDSCPEKSARWQNNRHSYRMPLESGGLLLYAFPNGGTPFDNNHERAHYKHPASIFTRNSKDNFEWVLEHFKVQLDEYKIRYKREHDSAKYLGWIESNYHTINFPNTGMTPFARCFGPFKNLLDREEPDTVKAYRRFYILDKINFARWPSIDKIPDFWVEKSARFVDKNFKNGIYTKR